MKKRTELINYLIEKHNYKSYLEIGVFDNDMNFNHINCGYKMSVDPMPEAKAIKTMTSDAYFKESKQKFDIIFIDGLHHSYQVLKDIENALEVLNEGGTIVMHDCLPTNEKIQLITEWDGRSAWTGDCWKAFVYLRHTRTDLEMFTMDMDWGCGIIRKGKQELLPLNCELNYVNFRANRDEWMKPTKDINKL